MEQKLRELLNDSYKGKEIIDYIESLEKVIDDMHDQAEIDALNWIINQKDNEIYRLEKQIEEMKHYTPTPNDEDELFEICPVVCKTDKETEKEKDNCFICNKHIDEGELCYFSLEFDSYLCKECHDKLEKKDYEELNDEEKILKNEFF